MLKAIIFGASTLLLTLAALVLPKAAASAPALEPMPATVQIVHTWQSITHQTVYQATAESLGTVIAPHLILTHNHYGDTLGHQSAGMLEIMDSAHHVWRVPVAKAQLLMINAGTGLLWWPYDLPVPTAPLADAANLQGLTAGKWITVNCWDDNTQGIIRRDFQIIQVKDGIAQLADPDLVIRPGDSGGGAYFNGKLIGNTWSINLDRAHHPAGSFNVALLPTQAYRYVP